MNFDKIRAYASASLKIDESSELRENFFACGDYSVNNSLSKPGVFRMANSGVMAWHSTLITKNEGKCVGLSFDTDKLEITVLVEGKI